MAATRLGLYQGACTLVGERMLGSLTEQCEARRLLDQAWDEGAVRACLEHGQWIHAMRTMRIDYDPDIERQFGYARAFDKPTDWVVTSAVCSDEFFTVPIIRYADEIGYWFCDLDVIYVRIVSDDPDYGGNLSLWRPAFTEYVKAYLASKIVMKLSGDKSRWAAILGRDLGGLHDGILAAQLKNAKNKDAMAVAPGFPPTGGWVLSRAGRLGVRGDGGNQSGPLIG